MGVRYTVKQVADLTGVPAATLRAWERRYGVVAPQRSSSRYRLYDDAEVARLARMAELVREGTPASLAAERVATLATETAPPPDPGPRHPVAAPAGQAPAFTELVLAAQRYDQRLLTTVLDGAFARSSFETTLEQWLMPALTELGYAWERGDVDISGEHFVSAAVHRRLSAAFDAAGANTDAPVVLVGLAPGALHQLGALAFAVCLRRQGIDVRFLGADVPQHSWVHSVRTLRPAGVIISVPMSWDADPATRLVHTLRADHPEVVVWTGGHGITDRGHELAVPTLPPSAVEAALLVTRELRGR